MERLKNLISELRRDTRGFMQRRRQRFGEVFKFSFLLQETVFVDATSQAGKDLLALEMSGQMTTAWPDNIKDLLGAQGLLFTDGAAHTRLRKVAAPAFSKPFLRLCLPIIQRTTARFISGWSAAYPSSVAIFPDIKEWALELNAEVTLGGLSDRQLGTIKANVGPWIAGLLLLPIALFDEQRKKAFKARDTIRDVLVEVMADVRARGLDTADGTSLVASFMAAADDDGSRLTDEMVLDTLLGVVFGGFSSTSSTAGCMLTHLARSPEARAAVAAEVASWPEEERAPGGNLNFDRLTQSPVLESIVAETLRLTPPVLGFFRKAETDVLLGGRLVEKGSRVLWGFDPANMSAAAYDEPKAFCPLRFVVAPAAAGGKAAGAAAPAKPPSFGAGIHSCMGIDIAKLELKVLLVAMVRDAEFSLAQGVGNEIAWSLELGEHPADNLAVVVKRR